MYHYLHKYMEMFWLIHMIIEAYLISSVLLFNSIYDIIISRQGFEKRVVSQDLQLWLSNVSCVKHKPYMIHQYLCTTDFQSFLLCHLIGTSYWGSVYSTCSGWKTGIIFYLIRSPFYNVPHSCKSETIVNDQVQEIQLTTSLDQEGIKRALQRVLERVP